MNERTALSENVVRYGIASLIFWAIAGALAWYGLERLKRDL